MIPASTPAESGMIDGHFCHEFNWRIAGWMVRPTVPGHGVYRVSNPDTGEVREGDGVSQWVLYMMQLGHPLEDIRCSHLTKGDYPEVVKATTWDELSRIIGPRRDLYRMTLSGRMRLAADIIEEANKRMQGDPRTASSEPISAFTLRCLARDWEKA